MRAAIPFKAFDESNPAFSKMRFQLAGFLRKDWF
jgi:hypothetical protein